MQASSIILGLCASLTIFLLIINSTPSSPNDSISLLANTQTADHAKKRLSLKLQHSKTTTGHIKNEIARAEAKLSEHERSASHAFAQWEKEKSVAETAETKASSLREIYEADKTRNRILQSRLKRLNRELAHRFQHVEAKKHKSLDQQQDGLSGGSARSDLKKYFAKLDAKTVKAQPPATLIVHSRKAKNVLGKSEEKIERKPVELKEIGGPNMWDMSSVAAKKVREAQKGLHDSSINKDFVRAISHAFS